MNNIKIIRILLTLDYIVYLLASIAGVTLSVYGTQVNILALKIFFAMLGGFFLTNAYYLYKRWKNNYDIYKRIK